MGNTNLSAAKAAKNDEFYTFWGDIENEMMAYWVYNKDVFKDKTILLPCDDPEWSQFTRFFARNFEQYQIKKLISTSYAPASNPAVDEHDPSEVERGSDQYDATKSWERGRKFVLERGVDLTGDGQIDIDDLQWEYLEGDGDFRSEEVTALRDEADMVITNGPFSLHREFVAWLIEGNVQFSIIGNTNSVTYKEIFPLIMNNKMWVGANSKGGSRKGNSMLFTVPGGAEIKNPTEHDGKLCTQVSAWWFTNIPHGRRYEKLQLMTMKDNLMYSRRKKIREQGYPEYDNYDAIEVAFTEAIPKDYDGVMGVPISFLDRYNPDQFEIVGITKTWDDPRGLKTRVYPTQVQVSRNGKRSTVGKLNDGAAIKHEVVPEDSTYYEVDGGIYTQVYARILIRHKS